MYQVLKALALPPINLLVASAIGLILIAFGRKRAGLALVWLSLGLLGLLSTDQVGSRLMRLVEPDAALAPSDLANTPAQAIVILGATVDPIMPEFGEAKADHLSLVRLRYGAFVHKQTGLPVLVSGGRVRYSAVPVADTLARELQDSFAVTVEWRERQSRNTQENAVNSAALLDDAGLSHIILVTEAFHMTRAAESFRSTGMTVTPAPTAFTRPPSGLESYLPSTRGLTSTYYALHEMLGRVWYGIAYR